MNRHLLRVPQSCFYQHSDGPAVVGAELGWPQRPLRPAGHFTDGDHEAQRCDSFFPGGEWQSREQSSSLPVPRLGF